MPCTKGKKVIYVYYDIPCGSMKHHQWNGGQMLLGGTLTCLREDSGSDFFRTPNVKYYYMYYCW